MGDVVEYIRMQNCDNWNWREVMNARGTTNAAVVAIAVFLMAAQTSLAAMPIVTNVWAQQRTLSTVVDIHYDVSDANGHTQTVLAAISTNAGVQYDISPTNFAGDIGTGIPVGTNKLITWDAEVDLPNNFTSGAVRVRVTAEDGVYTDLFCIVDVSGGPTASSYPVTQQSTVPPTNDLYKTAKIVLRRIPAGSFVMGSPTNELGHDSWGDETQHTVTLTRVFYMGVFEITQGQYSNVMGVNPSQCPLGAHGPTRPVEQVSWNTIRGGTWPTGTLLTMTFMGKLQSRTGLPFDLPTEAQWEYACRGGTPGAWNNGTTITNENSDGNLNILGRYLYDGGNAYSTNPVSGAHASVGSYQANNWGIYDMHGNVWEWCLDWYDVYGDAATNPPGPAIGSFHVVRGGGWGNSASLCRSASRCDVSTDITNLPFGFRLSLTPGQ